MLFEFLALIYKGWNWGILSHLLTRILGIQHHSTFATSKRNKIQLSRCSGIDSSSANLLFNIFLRLLRQETLGKGRNNIS